MFEENKISTSVLGSAGMSYAPLMTIGEGGMAQVHLAKASGPSGFEKLVVLKTIRRTALSNPRIRSLFADEARLCAQLNHPNLVQVHDVHLETEFPCLVMEFLDGKTLHEIQLAGALPRNMLLAVISEILAGLHYAHELRAFDGRLMKIVHRDMSPHNVFVTYDGAAKVLDFGIAKMAGATSDTATEDVKGKLSYMAPEQLLGGEVDRRADIFAVGVMLWECTVGRRMWEGVPEPAMMNRLVNGDIPEVPIQAELTQPLIDIIRKATAPEPAQRYSTARDFQSALDTYLAASGRRISMREVGQTFATVFAEERKQMAENIRRALLELAPVPVSSPTREEVTVLAVPTPDEESAPRRGIYVLALAVLITVFTVGWVLAAPLREKFRDADRAEDAREQNERNQTTSTAILNADATSDEINAGERRIVEADPQGSSAKVPPEEVADGQGISDDSAAGEIKVSSTATANVNSGTKTDHQPGKNRTTSVSKADIAPLPPPVVKQPTTAPSTAPAPAPAAAANCDTPYFYQNGIKAYRPECL